MRKFVPLLATLMVLASAQPARPGFLDDLLKEVTRPEGTKDERTVASGLREALYIGTDNAVQAVSREDGYLGNLKIRIPVPDELEGAEKLLRKVRMDAYVDEFILSMNRAAEKASPQAVGIFHQAIKDMTIVDAFDILRGDDTAATGYFREKTFDGLHALFRPIVTESMGQTGVVKSYKRLVDRYTSLPFVKQEPVDLEDYVTNRALEGLFHMVGEEERKIRKDPAARVSKLLREVFGGS